MFSGTLANVALERASMLRDMEYITEETRDAKLQEAILLYDTCDKDHKLVTEDNIISPEEREEIKRAIAQIPNDSNSAEEISRIMSTEAPGVGINDIMGIQSEVTDDEVYSTMKKELNTIGEDED